MTQCAVIEGLKPCPFCGEHRVSLLAREQPPGPVQYTIVCWSCAAEGGWAKTESGAKRHWDMRPEAQVGVRKEADNG